MIDEEREAEIRREARDRCLDEIEALSKGEDIEFGVGVDVNRAYYLAIHRYSQKQNRPKVLEDSKGLSIVELLGSRLTEYSDWCWENLERASVGKEPLPRLEWDKPQEKLSTYVDTKYFQGDKKVRKNGNG